MLRFTIPLDTPNIPATLSLVTLLENTRLEKEDPPQPGPEFSNRCAAIIRQGSVWLGNKRIKRPEQTIGELRQQALHMQSEPNWHNKDEISHIQVFWPEKPIAEYTMDLSQIIWEDQHLLIVYKPPGLNTCQSIFSDTYCLTWGVQKILDSRGGFPSDPQDTEQQIPGRYVVNTINRLDYATRGLVFYAKHKDAEIALHRMFMKRRVHKRYLVGTAPITGLTASPGYNLRINDNLEYKGKLKSAVTLVRLLACTNEQWWWAALPQTGRTHQIRKHFATRIAPITGDLAYGPQSNDDDETCEAPDNLQLACVAYRFRHPLTRISLRVSFLPSDIDFQLSCKMK